MIHEALLVETSFICFGGDFEMEGTVTFGPSGRGKPPWNFVKIMFIIQFGDISFCCVIPDRLCLSANWSFAAGSPQSHSHGTDNPRRLASLRKTWSSTIEAMSSKREECFLRSALQYESMEWSNILVGEKKKGTVAKSRTKGCGLRQDRC